MNKTKHTQHSVRLVRQPHGDACSAFFVDGAQCPLYVRDTKIETWRAMLGWMLEGLKGFDETEEGVSPDVARDIVYAYDHWRAATVEAARSEIVSILLGLDVENRRRVLTHLLALHGEPLASVIADSPSLDQARL
jgi:hypothetical protein